MTTQNTNVMDQIFAATLNAVATIENQQGKLTMHMWNHEATYDVNECKKVLAMKGKPRADYIVEQLCDASPSFAKVIADLDAIGKDKNKKAQRDALTKKRKNGIDLFTRAITATFFLRARASEEVDLEERVCDVMLRKDGGIQVTLGDGTADTLSNNQLVRNGNDAWKTLTGKSSNRAGGAPTAAEVSKTQTNLFTSVDSTLRRPDLDIDELSEDANRALNNAVATFVRKSFLHDGSIDISDVIDWISDHVADATITQGDKTLRKVAGRGK